MATTRHRYVDPDAAGAPANGTTWNQAYRSLSTAENGEDNTGDIVSSDEIVVFHCRSSAGTADTTGTTFVGWTTNATHYIVIVAEAVNTSYGGGSSETTDTGRHHGVWSTTHYRLSVSNATALTINEDYVRIIGVQLESVSPTAAAKHGLSVTTVAAPSHFEFDSLIVRGHNHATYTQTGMSLNDADISADLWNCLIYNIGALTNAYGIYSNTGNTNNIYSCTIIGGQYSLVQATNAGTLTAKNVYCGGSLLEDFYRSAGTFAKTNCASEDQSADDTGTGETATNCVAAAVAIDTDTFVNVTASSEDFHLAADGLSPLQSAGVDTSGDSAPLNFTTDIDGDTRTLWSIGADDGPRRTSLPPFPRTQFRTARKVA